MIELSIEDLELIYWGGLGERILQGGANGAQIGGSIGAGIGLGVGIAFGSIPAGPAIMVGGTIGALAGSRIGKPEFGTFAGHAIENFDWAWYRRYREIAEPIEREYSGGLP